jgi:hypothetical protein
MAQTDQTNTTWVQRGLAEWLRGSVKFRRYTPKANIDYCQWDVPSTMNDLDFVAPVRSSILFFILSLKAFAFVMLAIVE